MLILQLFGPLSEVSKQAFFLTFIGFKHACSSTNLGQKCKNSPIDFPHNSLIHLRAKHSSQAENVTLQISRGNCNRNQHLVISYILFLQQAYFSTFSSLRHKVLLLRRLCPKQQKCSRTDLQPQLFAQT